MPASQRRDRTRHGDDENGSEERDDELSHCAHDDHGLGQESADRAVRGGALERLEQQEAGGLHKARRSQVLVKSCRRSPERREGLRRANEATEEAMTEASNAMRTHPEPCPVACSNSS